ncbi:MAG: hypothetical protein ACOYON_02550 [Fimbriimonas sp.]
MVAALLSLFIAPQSIEAELKKHVTALVAPELEGRLVGSPGLARATTYLVEQMRGSGAEFFELPMLPLVRTEWDPSSTTLSVGSVVAPGSAELVISHPSQTFSGEGGAVLVRTNGDAPSLDNFRVVTGKIVFILGEFKGRALRNQVFGANPLAVFNVTAKPKAELGPWELKDGLRARRLPQGQITAKQLLALSQLKAMPSTPVPFNRTLVTPLPGVWKLKYGVQRVDNGLPIPAFVFKGTEAGPPVLVAAGFDGLGSKSACAGQALEAATLLTLAKSYGAAKRGPRTVIFAFLPGTASNLDVAGFLVSGFPAPKPTRYFGIEGLGAKGPLEAAPGSLETSAFDALVLSAKELGVALPKSPSPFITRTSAFRFAGSRIPSAILLGPFSESRGTDEDTAESLDYEQGIKAIQLLTVALQKP